MEKDERELVKKAVAGDEAALVELLRQFGPEVCQGLRRKIGSRLRSVLDAEDVLQVTYLEVFLRIDRFVPKAPGSFVAWLRRIAENNLHDAIRELERKKRPPPARRVEASDRAASAVVLLEHLGCTTTTASRHATRNEVQQALEEALQRLPEDYAVVIRLYDLEGRSAVEVGREMARSEGAVHMLRARAHDRLRDTIGSDSRFFSDRA